MSVNVKLNGAVPVLKYFAIKGRAEGLRLLFEDQGIKYEDVRVAREQWPALKQQLLDSGDNVYGQMPVVVINGKTLSQTPAIYRYFGKLLDLYGSNADEQYDIDNAAEGIVDASRDAAVLFGSDEAAKATYWSEKAPVHLGKLNKVVGRHGGPFVLGAKFSIADIIIFRFLENTKVGIPNLHDTYHHLAALDKAVAARPNIAAYLASDRVPK